MSIPFENYLKMVEELQEAKRLLRLTVDDFHIWESRLAKDDICMSYKTCPFNSSSDSCKWIHMKEVEEFLEKEEHYDVEI